MAKLSQAGAGNADMNGLRNLALEWLVTYAEKKPKYIEKSLPQFPGLILESCMRMMLEVEDGEEELKTWAAKLGDEEGDEDEDEVFHVGEQALDRIAEALGMDFLGTTFFALVGRFVGER